jgi:flagellar hook-associated protein 3 FlgL
MSGELAIRFSSRALLDVRRITNELADLQRQAASGAKADDLQGYAGSSSRLLNARTLRTDANTRVSLMTQLQARYGVQTASLAQVSDAATTLAQTLRQAVGANDGHGIETELELAFNSAVNALNQTWNGQPLFAGERQNGVPIRVQSLDELLTALTPDALYNEAERDQVIDLGQGAPVVLSAKASTMSQGLFDALRGLKLMLNDNGGAIGNPISADQEESLVNFANQLDAAAARFTNEEGRSGQLEQRFEDDLVRAKTRADLITKEIGDLGDADLAEVSIRLSSLMAQYEATAKTFADLSRMTLLNYLG